MIREFFISIYLFVFRILFNFFKLFPQETKTVCVASFGDNIFYLSDALSQQSNERIIVLKDQQCRYPFPNYIQTVPFFIKNPIGFLKSVFHLATAKTVVVDNYFGFLSAVQFRSSTTQIQVWHAVGAIKKFGLEDPSIKVRSKQANKRFKRVYRQFKHVTVASEKMAHIFKTSFSLSDDAIIRLGVPRTDLFFDSKRREKIITKFRHKYPVIKEKKVMLYAPTYRDAELSHYELKLDIDRLFNEFANEYVLFIKLHPSITHQLERDYHSFVYDVSSYYDVNHLLLISDLLITDYSSIPFEYALLDKPMIFYAYDQEEYTKLRGLINDYEQVMPGPIARTTGDIIAHIKNNNLPTVRIKDFSKTWNEYLDGSSSAKLAAFILEQRK